MRSRERDDALVAYLKEQLGLTDKGEERVRNRRTRIRELRAEQEKQAGFVRDMKAAGWKCTGFTPGGKSKRFWKKLPEQGVVSIVTARLGLWRAQRIGGEVVHQNGMTLPVIIKLQTPHMDTPVALAAWLELEAPNGRYRPAES